jgi:neutral ceramidase
MKPRMLRESLIDHPDAMRPGFAAVAAARRWLGWLALVAFAVGVRGASDDAAARVFRAGAALGDITPEQPGLPIVGNFVAPPATEIHDRLHARCLVLDDGAQRIAFVVCDNVGLPREFCDEAKRLVRAATGLDAAHVMISATHTHSAVSASFDPQWAVVSGEAETPHAGANAPPPPRPKFSAYQQFAAQRIAETVQHAIERLAPAKIGWGAVDEPAPVFNRRWFVRDEADRHNPFGGVDQVRMNPPRASPGLIKPAGPTDPQIAFVSIQAKDGRPLALLAAYSLHYVGVPPGVISADYYGAFAALLAELLGASQPDSSFVGILANGTSGDINNINFREKVPDRAPYEQMQTVANLVAGDVARACRTIRYRDWVPLDVRYSELPVASRRPTDAMIAHARALLETKSTGPAWHPMEKIYAGRTLQRVQAPEIVDLPLQVFRIGELGIMTVPAEPFAEIGLELKARAPFAQAFTIGIANGYSGYLPTPAQHKLGGYETWFGTNRLEVDASTKIVDELLRMGREMSARK